MTIERLLIIRRLVFLAIGAICVFYGLYYLLFGMTDVLNPFVPGVVGVTGAVILMLASAIGGRKVMPFVFDELSRAEWTKALKFGYWLAVGLYPVFGVALWQGWVTHAQAFAVMGTFTGGIPLLYYCWLDLRG